MLETVGPVYGEPGVARHWDDPTRPPASRRRPRRNLEGMIRHGDATANKRARAPRHAPPPRAARLVGGDGVSGDGHALKTPFPGPGKTVRRVRRARTDAPPWIWSANLNPTTDPSSVVREPGLARRSLRRFERRRRASRQTRAQVRAHAAFESFRNELAAIDVADAGARRPASKHSPPGCDRRRRRASARKTLRRDAVSAQLPRGLTLTQRLAAGGAAAAQGPTRRRSGARASRKDARRLGSRRRQGRSGRSGRFGAVGTQSHPRTRATLPTDPTGPGADVLALGAGRSRHGARAQRRRAGGAAADARRGARRAPATAAGDGSGPGAARRRAPSRPRRRARRARTARRARARRGGGRRGARARGAAQGAPQTPRRGGSRATTFWRVRCNAGAPARAAIGVVDAGASALRSRTTEER